MKRIKLLFLLFSLVLGLGACSNDNSDGALMYDSFAFEPEFESDYLFHAVSEEFDVGDEVEEMRLRTPSPAASSSADAVSTTIAADRVIHRANIGIVVDDFDEGVVEVQELTVDFAGFIENSHITGESRSSFGRIADFTIRVPVESYEDMLEMLADLGDLNFLNTAAVNVSAQYADIVSRLTSLRAQEDRVLELVESAEDLADLLLLEQRLGELIFEIELLTGERNHLDNQISFSTIDVTISEYVDAFVSVDFNSQSLGDVFVTSFRALGEFGGIVIRVFVAFIPWLIPGSVVFLIIRWIWRRRRGEADGVKKKRRLGKKKQESNYENDLVN